MASQPLKDGSLSHHLPNPFHHFRSDTHRHLFGLFRRLCSIIQGEYNRLGKAAADLAVDVLTEIHRIASRTS